MPPLTARPIIKSWGEDTSNKDAPSQTAIGTGIVYGGAITSSQPNGAEYIIYEAVKNLQRTGGLYASTIPYSKGQACSVLCNMGTRYALRWFICTSPSDVINDPPISGATITTLNGIDVYSGGRINTSFWSECNAMEGFAVTNLDVAWDGTVASVPAFGAVNIGDRQYVNITSAAVTSINPETKRSAFMKAPTLNEVLAIMDGIYYPKWASQNTSIVTYPIRRLGVYNFRGQKVEAFGYFMNGNGFTENGSSNNSLFWRSMSSDYSANCIIENATMRDLFFSGSAGNTITPKNYIGRVQACAGTPILSSGTADARAALAGVQDDQVEGHRHGWINPSQTTTISGAGGSSVGVNSGTSAVIGDPIPDGTHGPVRVGYNTREATFTGPVPMIVSILPYGQITL